MFAHYVISICQEKSEKLAASTSHLDTHVTELQSQLTESCAGNQQLEEQLQVNMLFAHIVGGSRGLKQTNRNFVRQITKFGIIVFCKILINS